MCPNCRAFISMDDRVCPYCEAQLGPRAIDRRPSVASGSFLPNANTTSIVILTINCVFFLIEYLVNLKFGGTAQGIAPGVFHILGDKFGPDILAGQWWRLLTAGLLHGGLFHLAVNSYSLLILVTEVEQFYGTARLIVAYVASTFAGFLLSTIMNPMVPSLGASAAAFGLIGIMLAMSVRRRHDPLALMVRTQYTQWIIFSVVLTVFARGIDIWAHLGGAVAGFLIGLVAGLPGLPNSPGERFWKGVAGAAVLVTVFAIILDFLQYRTYLQQI